MSGIFSNIESQINRFEPISLDSINKVKLLNRVDTKYVFHIDQILKVIDCIKSEYLVLEIDQKRLMHYKSLYYDYKDFKLYRLHQNEKLNRFKVRVRQYTDTNTMFLETKFKNNKGRTNKLRVPKSGAFDLNMSDKEFINSNTQILAEDLLPSLWVHYNRVTLVSKAMNERVTIDLGLNFDNGNKKKFFEQLVIAEVKRDNSSSSSPFVSLMKDLKIKKSGLSKYCIGMVSTYNNIKYNNMKPKMRHLNKIANNYDS